MASPASRPSVLVVDDDPAMRLLFCVNLEAAGLAVHEAVDGRQALMRARRKRPDLVLTDVKMPRLDGFQLAEALRADERTREIPLIFVSAEDAPESRARARALGALAYLTKPFDPLALASLVADALTRSGNGTATPELAGADRAA